MKKKFLLYTVIIISILLTSCSSLSKNKTVVRKGSSFISRIDSKSIAQITKNTSVGYSNVRNTKKTHYQIGENGPAGGIIFYDCDADNSSGNTDGLISSECGWRYLEVSTKCAGSYPFSPDSSYSFIGTKSGVGSGVVNTKNLVASMGSGLYAAKVCADYSVVVDGVIYDDWFLPSEDELNLIYRILVENGFISITDAYYWSSTENNNTLTANLQYFENGYQTNSLKSESYNVLPIRAFQTYEFNVGDIGPAGGYIFYDCDADNDSGNADGLISSKCGWRYLEVLPYDLTASYPFGYYRSYSVGANKKIGTGTSVGTGLANTEALVQALGETAYVKQTGTLRAVYAAKACDDFCVIVDDFVFDDWFLPSKDELILLYNSLEDIGLEISSDEYYWSSSEPTQLNNTSAYVITISNGFEEIVSRNTICKVRPIRAFNVCSSGINHNYKIDFSKTIAPTCINSGQRIYSCTNCGQTKKEILVATGIHVWDGGTIWVSASCGSSGRKNYTCMVCGQTKEESIAPTGLHSWDAGVVTTKATCASNGVKTYTCTVCGNKKEESISPTGLHSWDAGVVTTEATCVSEGIKTFTCTVCGQKKEEKIRKANTHKWDDGVITKEATCTSVGIKTYTCNLCGTIKTEKIEPHSWDDGIVMLSATCSKNGLKVFTCKVCKKTKTEKTTLIDHTWDYGVVSKAATCTSDGLKTYTCTICGQKKTEAITHGHKYVDSKCIFCGALENGPSSGFIIYDDVNNSSSSGL